MAGLLLGRGHEEVLGPELLESQHLIHAEQNECFERHMDQHV